MPSDMPGRLAHLIEDAERFASFAAGRDDAQIGPVFVLFPALAQPLPVTTPFATPQEQEAALRLVSALAAALNADGCWFMAEAWATENLTAPPAAALDRRTVVALCAACRTTEGRIASATRLWRRLNGDKGPLVPDEKAGTIRPPLPQLIASVLPAVPPTAEDRNTAMKALLEMSVGTDLIHPPTLH